MKPKHLIVLVGPTAVGKTGAAIHLAQQLGCDIISADSRQMYKALKIGTAAPAEHELSRVKHHFIHFLKPDSYYNASRYENEVLILLERLFSASDIQLLTGGSMMYVDAVVKGIDAMPDVDPEIRNALYDRFNAGEIDALRMQLKMLDPDYYFETDLKNPVRIIHALEVCLTTGKKFSSFRKQKPAERPFNIIKIGLDMPREDLFKRINQRVVQMIDDGLEKEVKTLYRYKACNALQTVGYKEMFDYLDGKHDLDRAVELIQRNTRRYAKKQLTWFKKDPETVWFNPENGKEVLDHVMKKMKSD